MKFKKNTAILTLLSVLTFMPTAQVAAQTQSAIPSLSDSANESGYTNTQKPSETYENAVKELQQNLRAEADSGNSSAQKDLETLTSLTPHERQSLGKSLVSGEVETALVSGKSTGQVKVSKTTTPRSDRLMPNAWNGWDYNEGCITASRLGIDLVRVCTGGQYRSVSGMAVETRYPVSKVVFNKLPGSDITTSNLRGYVWNGSARFEAEVKNTIGPNISLGPFAQVEGTHTVVIYPWTNSVIINGGI